MRFYPDSTAGRARTIVRDLSIVTLVGLFAWLGVQVHDAVDALAVVPHGVESAGGAVETGFRDAAAAVDGVPVVGGDLAAGIRGAGGRTGGNVVELGHQGERKVHRLANVLGLVMFVLPTGLVLLGTLPARMRQIRRLTAARQFLLKVHTDEEQRLVAMRAAFSLPYDDLLRHTQDPFGDLAAERYEALVAAALEEAGLRALVR